MSVVPARRSSTTSTGKEKKAAFAGVVEGAPTAAPRQPPLARRSGGADRGLRRVLIVLPVLALAEVEAAAWWALFTHDEVRGVLILVSAALAWCGLSLRHARHIVERSPARSAGTQGADTGAAARRVERVDRMVGRVLAPCAWVALVLAVLVAPALLPAPGAWSAPLTHGVGPGIWAGPVAATALAAGVGAFPLAAFTTALDLIVGSRRSRPILEDSTVDALTSIGLVVCDAASTWHGLEPVRRCCTACIRGAAAVGVGGVFLLALGGSAGGWEFFELLGSKRAWLGVAGFVVIAIAVLLCLARTLRAAAVVAPISPVAREAWRASRERTMAVAEIHGDARNVLIAYCATVVAPVLAGLLYGMAVYGSAAWSLLGPRRSPAALLDAATSTVLIAAQPYATGALSVLTVGAVAGLFSAQKKLTVLRADVAHRQRVWEQP